MTNHLPFSIVVSTNGRRDSLSQTLDSFRYLDYPNFEVCVIYGPTPDGTLEMLESWRDRIKTRPCPVRNISVSRNLGIGLAAGDIVAFIDDDAIPESDWLARLNDAYQDTHVTAAGGFVYDASGVNYQWRFGTTDRIGRADLSWQRAMPEFNFPLSINFPHLLGANCSARRAAAIEIGGFDENYEYYLDETDFLCRLVDAGGYIAQLNGACVHHKLRPSHIRDETQIVKNWYPVIKNKIYYSLINNRGHYPLSTVFEDVLSQIKQFGSQIDWAISAGLADESDRVRLDEHVEQAWRDGLSVGLAQQRKLRSQAEFANHPKPFLPFQTLRPVGRRKVFCFLSQGRDPSHIQSTDRFTGRIAATLSKMGHEVHVFICGDETAVDFAEGVWVHRIRIAFDDPPPSVDGVQIPVSVWNDAAGLARAVREFATRHSIEAVFAPFWGWEGLALRNDGFPLIAVLQMSLPAYLDAQPKTQQAFSTQNIESSILSVARLLLDASKLAIGSEALARETRETYGVAFAADRLMVIPERTQDRGSFSSDRSAAEILGLAQVDDLEMRQCLGTLLHALEVPS